MPSYSAPVRDYQFLLHEVLDVSRHNNLPGFSELDNETLQELNAQVDVEGREPVDVAFDWMVSEGFISEPAAGSVTRN